MLPTHPDVSTGRVRRAAESGFTLIELAIVVTLIAILATISMVGIRAALLVARAGATTANLRTYRDAFLSLQFDCRLPVWTTSGDPGLTYSPGWADTGCWRGPYLPDWLDKQPLGNSFAYVAEEGATPALRVGALQEGEARLLASRIVDTFGPASLGPVGASSGGWSVDLLLVAGAASASGSTPPATGGSPTPSASTPASTPPSVPPSASPSAAPSSQPSAQPTTPPSANPSTPPSANPTTPPSANPSAQPSAAPTKKPKKPKKEKG